MTDLVYPLKVVGNLDELRYSLRSVNAFASGIYDKVWVITKDTLPDWLININVIQAGSGGNAAIDVRSKILAATGHPAVSNDFILMNDDFFIVSPISTWQTFNLGSLSDNIERWEAEGVSRLWLRAVKNTERWMRQQGYTNTMSYHGHVPLRWDKEKLNGAIKSYPTREPFSIIGLYPMCGIGGEGIESINSKVTNDKKFYAKVNVDGFPYLSSNEQSFNDGAIGEYIRHMFREPSVYERT